MNSGAIKSLVICAFGVAMMAGCASSQRSAPVASVQENVRSGKITAVENVAVVDQTTTGASSGGSTVVTTASGGPSAVTVQFNDGTESKYIIERPMAPHKVGEAVSVITNGDAVTIVSQ